MRTSTTLLRALALGIATALLIGAEIAPIQTSAQTSADARVQPDALSITVPTFVVYATGNPNGAVVNYLPAVQVSDPTASLSCDPPSGVGMMPRGATEITCTATLDDATATTRFFVLVAYDSDTDVSLRSITHTPESPVRPASELSYLFEVRNNALRTANRVIVSGTLPEAIELRSYDTSRCTLTAERLLTCTLFSLAPGKGDAITLIAQVRPGVTGSFQTQMTVSLGDGQRDLEPSLNTFTKTTTIEDPGFGPNSVFVPLLHQ